MIRRRISLPLPLGRYFVDRLLGNFVRRLGRDVELLAAAIDQQIAIAHARVELKSRQRSSIARRSPMQLLRLGVGDPAGGVVLHDAVDDGDEVAAKDPIGRRQRDAAAPRLPAAPGRCDRSSGRSRAGTSSRRRCRSRIPRARCATIPCGPRIATRSMLGVCAASSGVLPPSSASGSSAAPSGMMMAYFIACRVQQSELNRA